MDENRLIPDESRPTQGGSYVRLPDGNLMPEGDWLAARQAGAGVQEAQATSAEARTEPAPEAPPPPARPAAKKKEG